MSAPVKITRVMLHNYKSIAWCDVALDKLHFLLGANGAGKSNFLDALRFVRDALTLSLEQALDMRGGASQIIFKNILQEDSFGDPLDFSIRIELLLAGNIPAIYVLEVSKLHARMHTTREAVRIGSDIYFDRHMASCHSSASLLPPLDGQHLSLVALAGLQEFRPLYEALCNMNFYHIQPEMIRGLHNPQDGSVLKLHGENLGNVITRLQAEQPESKARILSYLQAIVPEIHDVTLEKLRSWENLAFWMKRYENWPSEVLTNMIAKERLGPMATFTAQDMSDGTLRALAILCALFQTTAQHPLTLIAIEEPETGLHPAACAVLREAILEASHTAQIMVTSHSQELLNDASIEPDTLLVVELRHGASQIATIDQASREMLQQKLFYAGELLGMKQLAGQAVAAVPVMPNVFEGL
jgi:predicted ATPase